VAFPACVMRGGGDTMPEDPGAKSITKSATGCATVYFDGKCPMCVALMTAVRTSAQRDLFDLRDMHRQRWLPFGRDAIARDMHLIDRDGTIHRGAAAMLRIASRFPRLRRIAEIADLPPIRPLSSLGYRLVAANRQCLFGAASRVFWLKAIVISLFCLGLVLSSHLWIGPRVYPTAPLFDLLPTSIHPVDFVLFVGLFALAPAILLARRPQKFIVGFLAVIAVFCLLDQTRWQPWVYQYSVLLGILAFFSWDGDDVRGRRRALNIARLIVATTYIFSGLQKANLNFIENDFMWFVEPITKIVPAARGPLSVVAMAAPLVQVGFGIGLLTTRYRRIALVLAVSMHLFILAMFGPFGHDWNDIVWPWTAGMAALDLLLFTPAQQFSWREIFQPNGHPYHVLALALFAILPLLSFFNLWDSYLSSALYSGNLTEAIIYATDRGTASLPSAIRSAFVHTSPDTNVLNIQRWAIEYLNVTPYPEPRVYRTIARFVCNRSPYQQDFVLLVREQRMFFSRPETGYRCLQL
jgi:predicted DCC family thiol-disulfide oxidoreductase YuxK